MNTKKMNRREAREELFKLIFQADVQGISVEQASQTSSFLENYEVEERNRNFIESYIRGLDEHAEELRQKIESVMTDWDFPRLPYVERSLLKLAAYEICCSDMAVEVASNEAVELAKVYGDVKTSDFINGVLAKLIRQYRVSK